MVHRMRSYVMTFFVQSFNFIPCHKAFFIIYVIAYYVECSLKTILVKNWLCMGKLSLATIIEIYYYYFVVGNRRGMCVRKEGRKSYGYYQKRGTYYD